MNSIKNVKNLELKSLKYTPMAIVSIVHRITGIFLFITMPILLTIIYSLSHKEQYFHALQIMLKYNFYFKFIIWVFLSSLFYHIIAGIRHFCIDFGYCNTLKIGYVSSIIVIILTIIQTLIIGIIIW